MKLAPLCLIDLLLVFALSANAANRSDILRGSYGPYRANNDLLFYHLDVRVDPEKKFLQGKNTIRFRMLKDGRRIQLDLHPALHIDKILFGGVRLSYKRDSGAVFVDFPQTLLAGQRVHHRLLLLGSSGRDGQVWRHHFPQRPRRPSVDQHCVRRDRRQRVVAKQGPMAR